jgi:O-antigen/teichoic acid export membrane protein
MFAGAGPVARWVLNNETLASMLRIAAIASAAIVLLECCRGLLIGQQKFYPLLALSVVSGAGLIIALPLAAGVNAGMMIAVQAGVSLACVLLFLVLAKRFGLIPRLVKGTAGGPGVRRVFTFGMVQFGAYAGVSIASWWLASMVARSDVTLTQMGLYAIANQFRGLAAMAPGLCEQVGYPLLTDETGSQYGGPSQVLLTNSLVSTVLATAIAGSAIVTAPWLLGFVYGAPFAAAEVPVVILLATGIIHMSSGPAAQRLSIVRLRWVGIINTFWAISLAVVGVWLVPQFGATGAALAFLITHTISYAMVMTALATTEKLPSSYYQLYGTTTIGSIVLAALAYWRALGPDKASLTLGLAAVALVMLATLVYLGARSRCLPGWKFLDPKSVDHEQSDVG